MYRIVEKTSLNPTVTKMVVEAPLVAKKALPGQFVILRACADSERIPLTVADYDREKGTVTVIFQVVGAGTMELNTRKEGEVLHDFVGPLGRASELDGLKKVCVVGGGGGPPVQPQRQGKPAGIRRGAAFAHRGAQRRHVCPVRQPVCRLCALGIGMLPAGQACARRGVLCAGAGF